MPRSLFLFVLGLLPVVAYGDGYICAADLATGFSSKGGTWSAANFEPDRKFIVNRPGQGEQSVASVPDAKWSVLVLGDKAPTNGCPEFDTLGNLICLGPFSEFRMSKDSLRFLYSYLSGYWDRPPLAIEAGDTPYIAIGKCSPK
jgi:hypothetical protein